MSEEVNVGRNSAESSGGGEDTSNSNPIGTSSSPVVALSEEEEVHHGSSRSSSRRTSPTPTPPPAPAPAPTTPSTEDIRPKSTSTCTSSVLPAMALTPSAQYIDLMVESCRAAGRVAFKDGKQMKALLHLEDVVPEFVIEDWAAEGQWVPEDSVLGSLEVKPYSGAAHGGMASKAVEGVSSVTRASLGTAVAATAAVGSWMQWTVDTTVTWGRWVFRMDPAALTADETNEEEEGCDDEGNQQGEKAEEKERGDSPSLRKKAKEKKGSSSPTAPHPKPPRYVFLPALRAVCAGLRQYIAENRPMIDTVFTTEEWADLLLDELRILDGPLVTAYVLNEVPPRFYALNAPAPPPPRGGEGTAAEPKEGEGMDPSVPVVGVASSTGSSVGGMFFSTSDRPEFDSAESILGAKWLRERMEQFVKGCEEKLTEADEFGLPEDSSHGLALEGFRLNKLFSIQLDKSIRRLRGRRDLSVGDIAASLDTDCLAHFPGEWPRVEEDERHCM